MKGISFLALLAVVVVAIAPTAHGLEAGAIAEEGGTCAAWCSRLRASSIGTSTHKIGVVFDRTRLAPPFGGAAK